jgi:hypothetical protein
MQTQPFSYKRSTNACFGRSTVMILKVQLSNGKSFMMMLGTFHIQGETINDRWCVKPFQSFHEGNRAMLDGLGASSWLAWFVVELITYDPSRRSPWRSIMCDELHFLHAFGTHHGRHNFALAMRKQPPPAGWVWLKAQTCPVILGRTSRTGITQAALSNVPQTGLVQGRLPFTRSLKKLNRVEHNQVGTQLLALCGFQGAVWRTFE